jgi:hypothetical protein
MAGVFLEPGDVGPADASAVLRVLNEASTAAELAAAIELPGWPDIGVRLADRLLRRREQLGGRFTDLAEVAAVPLIGPARFTHLVVAITGASPEEVAGRVPDDLRAEIAALRTEVATLAAAVRPVMPTLRLRSGGRWLGEPAQLVAGVASRGAGAPLLVVADTGRLQTTADGTPIGGRAVLVTTGALGEAEFTWLPPATDRLDPGQRAALAARLPLLGDAAAPAEAAQALTTLATDYLREPARAFREAVDGLWQEHADAAGAGATSGPPGGWPATDAKVSVHVLAARPSDAAGATVVAMAAMVLRSRDWLVAFAEALRQRLADTATLASQLRAEAGRDQDAAALGAAFQARVASWVANRPGVLAREVAVEVAQAAVHAQLLAATEGRSLAEREALVPLLSSTARVVGQAPARLIGALEATGSVVRRDVIDRLTKLPVPDPNAVAGLSQRLDAVQASLGAIDERTTAAVRQVERLAAQLRRRVTTQQLNKALASKLDGVEGAKIEELLARVQQLERRMRPR